jgi:pentapeptide repeat protein
MGGGQTDDRKTSAPPWIQTVTALAGIVSVLLVAVGLYITNAANRAQQQLTEQGQITDRFGRAIDQLGSDKLDVRLGGVYALERLMHDSSADEPNIIEVLSAYIRDHTHNSAESHATTWKSPPVHVSTDVQAALTVLGRRPDPIHHHNIDLTYADIADAYLGGADLVGANLGVANLTHAYLAGANLAGANLVGANLSGTYLTGAYLYRADLRDANLTHAWLVGANLAGAKFYGANLSGVTWPLKTPVPQGWARDPATGRLNRANAGASNSP